MIRKIVCTANLLITLRCNVSILGSELHKLLKLSICDICVALKLAKVYDYYLPHLRIKVKFIHHLVAYFIYGLMETPFEYHFLSDTS